MEIIISNLLLGLAAVLSWVLTIAMWLVIIRALLSWVNPDPYNPIVRFLDASTEPLLTPILRKVKTVFGGIDLAPIFLLIAIIFLQHFLVETLREFGMRIKLS